MNVTERLDFQATVLTWMFLWFISALLVKGLIYDISWYIVFLPWLVSAVLSMSIIGLKVLANIMLYTFIEHKARKETKNNKNDV